jgi:hypothetical protein
MLSLRVGPRWASTCSRSRELERTGPPRGLHFAQPRFRASTGPGPRSWTASLTSSFPASVMQAVLSGLLSGLRQVVVGTSRLPGRHRTVVDTSGTFPAPVAPPSRSWAFRSWQAAGRRRQLWRLPSGHRSSQVVAGIWHTFLAVIRSSWAHLSGPASTTPPSRSSPAHRGLPCGPRKPWAFRSSLAPSLSVIAGARSSWISVIPALSGHRKRQIVVATCRGQQTCLAPPFRSSQAPGCRRHLSRLPDRHRRRQAVVATSRASLPGISRAGHRRRGHISRPSFRSSQTPGRHKAPARSVVGAPLAPCHRSSWAPLGPL